MAGTLVVLGVQEAEGHILEVVKVERRRKYLLDK